MNTVVTILAADRISDASVRAAEQCLATTVDWLAKGVAGDLATDLPPPEAEQRVRGALAGAPVDVVAQAATGRRKRLLVADMESTIIENEMLDELAEELGLRERIAAITARAMRGELDFEGALRERVAMLAGLEIAALERAQEKIRIMPGARALVATMRAGGAYCALVSGGFDYYTAIVRAELGFDYDQANRLGVRDGKLSGEVIPPILGRDAKRAALERLARERGIEVCHAITVGDGANDLDMLAAAGTGVAFRAKPLVAEAARARIDHGDLTALLYIQGYRRDEFH
jgi:phosphoserine phosphatase